MGHRTQFIDICNIKIRNNEIFAQTSAGAMSRRTSLVLILSLLVQGSLQQYGHLEDPPARGSMWRYGFNTPVNNEDNSLNCGGKQVQMKNQGRCGVCGDAYDGIRAHEYGGKYATGLISKSFPLGTEQIQIIVRNVSPQLGSYEFRICSKDNLPGGVTQACLDQNVLLVRDDTSVNSDFRSRYYVTPSIRNMLNHRIIAKLPTGFTCVHCVLQWKFLSVPDRDGYREEYVNCADISIGRKPSMTGTGTVFQESGTVGTNNSGNSGNSSVADMTNSELLEALLVLADIEPVPNKVTPLSNPMSPGAQQEKNIPKHEQLIQQLQSLGVLVPIDSPNQGSPNAVETLLSPPDAQVNPDYFLEQLQDLGVLVPVDPSPSALQQTKMAPSGQTTSSARSIQSLVPDTAQLPSSSPEQLVQPLKDIGVLVPVDEVLSSGQANQNAFNKQDSKMQNVRENELAKQLHGLGVIVPVGHVVQSPNLLANKDSPAVPVNNVQLTAPSSNNIKPTNSFSSSSRSFQSNNFHSSQKSQNTQNQHRTSQLGDIFNSNVVRQNQLSRSEQLQEKSSKFTSSQGEMSSFLSPTKTETHMESSKMFSSSSSFRSSGFTVSSGSEMIRGEPREVNSKFGNFGSVQSRDQQQSLGRTMQRSNQQLSTSNQIQSSATGHNAFGSQNNLKSFQNNQMSHSSNFQQGSNFAISFSSKGSANNLSPSIWKSKNRPQSLSQNFQSSTAEVGGFGLSGNNKNSLSQNGGAFLGDVVQGSDKRNNGIQSLSRSDSALSSPAGSLSSKSQSQSKGFHTQESHTSQVISSADLSGNIENEKIKSSKDTLTSLSIKKPKKESISNVINLSASTSVKQKEQGQTIFSSSAIVDAFGNVAKTTQTESSGIADKQHTVSKTEKIGSLKHLESTTVSFSNSFSAKNNELTNTKTDVDSLGINFSKMKSKNSPIADNLKFIENTNSKTDIFTNIETSSKLPNVDVFGNIVNTEAEVFNPPLVNSEGNLFQNPTDNLIKSANITETSENKAVKENQQKSTKPDMNLKSTLAPTTPKNEKEMLTIQVPSLDMLMPIQLTTPPLIQSNSIITTVPSVIDVTKTPKDNLNPSPLSTVGPSFRQIPLESINNSPAFPSVEKSKHNPTSIASSLPSSVNETWGTKEKLIDQQGKESTWVSPNELKTLHSVPSNKFLDPSFDPNIHLQSTSESTVQNVPVRNSNHNVHNVRHRLDPALFGIGAVPKFDAQIPSSKIVSPIAHQTIRPLKPSIPQSKQSPVSFRRHGLTIQKSVIQTKYVQSPSSSVPLPPLDSLFKDSRTIQKPKTKAIQRPTAPKTINQSQRKTNIQGSPQQIPENTARVEVVVRNPADSIKFFSTINSFPLARRRRILNMLRQNRITNLQFTNPQMITHLANMHVQRFPNRPRPTAAQISHFMQRLSSTSNGRRLLNQWRQRVVNRFQPPQRLETIAPPITVQATATPKRENSSQSTSTTNNSQNTNSTLEAFFQRRLPVANAQQQFNSAVNLVRQLQREQQAEELLQQQLQDYTRNGQFSLARTVLNTLQLLQRRRSGLLQQIQELRREIQTSSNRLQAEMMGTPNERAVLRLSRSQTPLPRSQQRQQSSPSPTPPPQLSRREQVPAQQQLAQIQRQQSSRQPINRNGLQQVLVNRQTPAGSLSTQPRTFTNRNARLRNLLRRAQRNPFAGMMNRSQIRTGFPVNNRQFFG
ncbi:uncharacterized protein LOC133187056 [Saccostrea echinata]|uniref:uncharacterized protein LOC133187056 n=1 Tax=Saccostrea echinata TaxID=191078 RepID=UPI002A839FFA|nr:uncharacterized protein LOC133187056 [Saccostrea echinata]